MSNIGKPESENIEWKSVRAEFSTGYRVWSVSALLSKGALFFVLIFGMIFQAELFVSQLWSFGEADYSCSVYEVPSGQTETFLVDVANACETAQVGVFAIHDTQESNIHETVTVYGDSQMIRDSLAEQGISEGSYHSFLSGTVEVHFAAFDELASVHATDGNVISYIGDDDSVYEVWRSLSETYELSEPCVMQATEHDMVLIIWLFVAIIMILLACMQVMQRKKEVLIRRVMGESIGKIVGKSMIFDFIFYIVLWVAARLFLKHYLEGFYADSLALAVYIAGAVLSLLPYLAFFVFDIRKAFAGGGENSGLYAAICGLKVLTFAVAVFTVTTNFGSLYGHLFSGEDLFEQYADASYIKSVGETDAEDVFWAEVYETGYDELNPIICVNVMEDREDVILVNQNASACLDGFSDYLGEIDADTDVAVLVKDNSWSDTACENAGWCLEDFFEDTEKLNVQYILYDDRQTLSYLSANEMYGASETTNPVVIYQVNEDAEINGENIMLFASGSILFDVDDASYEKIESVFYDVCPKAELIRTSVSEQTAYTRSFMVRLISFLSSFCILTLVLNLFVTFAVNSADYRRHAMEFSLLKIFGYGMRERYKRNYRFVFFSDVGVILLISVVGIFWDTISIPLALAVGILLLAAAHTQFVMGVEVLYISYSEWSTLRIADHSRFSYIKRIIVTIFLLSEIVKNAR